MNAISKSVLPVIVTIVSSGMLLLTGHGFAYSMMPLEAPPGPFVTGQQSLSAPVAPNKPINGLIQATEPFNAIKQSLKPSIMTSMGGGLNKLSQPKEPIQPQIFEGNVPELGKKIGLPSLVEMPTVLKNTNKQPIARKQPKMSLNEHPIWMQKRIHKSGSNIEYRQFGNYTGMPTMGWNNSVPPQPVMYIPFPMVNFNGVPPQMPIFNRNYNPPQFSWMPNFLNNIPAPQQKIAPVQKDLK